MKYGILLKYYIFNILKVSDLLNIYSFVLNIYFKVGV